MNATLTIKIFTRNEYLIETKRSNTFGKGVITGN
jgi:hypothetical protein